MTFATDQFSSALQLLGAKQYAAAEELLARIPSDSPHYPDAVRHLAVSAGERHDFPAAEIAALSSIKVNGETEEALLILATALRRQRKFPEAAAAFARLVK